VAEIVGGRRSVEDACSGSSSSRVIIQSAWWWWMVSGSCRKLARSSERCPAPDSREARPLTYVARFEAGAISRCHSKCLHVRWKDDHRYTIWPALLTPASQHRRGQTIQGTRRPDKRWAMLQ
jgi:hypothetical protein